MKNVRIALEHVAQGGPQFGKSCFAFLFLFIYERQSILT